MSNNEKTFTWSDQIGLSLIKSVSLLLNGVVIDSYDPDIYKTT